jgi:hypothetical protein
MAADRDDDTRAAAPGGPGDGSRDAVWRQEMARLDQLCVVGQAQDLVAAAEQTDLSLALAAACQRVVDAQRRLTQAPAEADPAAVAAAAAGVEDARWAAQVLATRLAAQQRQLAEDRMRTIEEVVAQAGRVVDAGLAATDAPFGIARPDRPDARPDRRDDASPPS